MKSDQFSEGVMAEPVSIEKVHVTSDPAIRRGRPCIADSGIAVQDVVLWIESGASVDDVVVAYPHVSLADVYAALAYYYDHKDSIDQAIRDDHVFIKKLKQQSEKHDCGL